MQAQPNENPFIDPAEVAEDVSVTADETLGWLREHGAEWGLALAIIGGVFLLLRLARTVLAKVVGSDGAPPNAVRNIAASLIRATNSLFLLLIATTIVLPFFVALTGEQAGALGITAMIVSILQVAFWVRVIATAFISRIGDQHSAEESTLANAMGLITVFVNVIVFAVALVVIFDNLGLDVTGLVAGLGVGGIAIGLAAQSLFEDLFAGLSIILDKPFVRGDFVAFGDENGVVEKVGLKSTRIRTLTGQQLILNNSKLLDNEINNFRRMAERRVVTRVGVTYATPHETLRALPGQIREVVERHPDMVRFDRCHLAAYGDFAIQFELVFYVLTKDYAPYMDVQQEIFLDLHALFEREGVEFAFPTQTVHVGSLPEGQGARTSMAAE